MTRSQLDATTLGDIASRDYRAMVILDRYGLDYCCGGARSLAEGCRQRGVDVERVLSEIDALDPDPSATPELSPPALIDHIVAHHHTYIRMTAPLIRQHLAKVVARHEARHPELRAIARQFDTLADELRLHMLKEEQVLFPHITGLSLAVDHDAPAPPDRIRSA
jgi:regulator of cell morphogenesis and NO signaling